MANFNFNKVILGGRVCGDPELRTTPEGVSVTSFSVAVNRQTKSGQEAQFFDVTAWRSTAEFITKYFRRGSSICVVGRLATRSWVDKDNVKRYGVSVVADEVCFVDSKAESPAAAQGVAYVPEAYSAPKEARSGSFQGPPSGGPMGFEEACDEDLPF